MWSISDMKERGWAWVRSMYGAAYLACLAVFIVDNLMDEKMNPLLPVHLGNSYLEHLHTAGLLQALLLIISFSAVACTVGLLGIFFKFLVANPIAVGINRYFLASREQGEPAGLGTVASIFFGKGYWNVVKIMFFRDLYTFLWTLLLFIPGIYKGLEYRMIPYLLAEDPELPQREAFAQTKRLMEGNRVKSFLLDLSFIGWNLLAAIVGSILVKLLKGLLWAGFFWITLWVQGMVTLLVSPYSHAAWTELYCWLNHRPEVFDENGDSVY
ncbi:MAG: DUF975 family protein [Clostridium sp.]|nr:DUF975 family protein [Clostridium sp.]